MKSTKIKCEQLKIGLKALRFEGNIESFTKDDTPFDSPTILIEKYFAVRLNNAQLPIKKLIFLMD